MFCAEHFANSAYLLGTTMQEVSKSLKQSKLVLKEIPIISLRAGQYQPRHVFSQEGLNSLAETIKNVGILEPLLVRHTTGDMYEIIAGERRWRAAKIAGLKTVPCLVGYYNDETTTGLWPIMPPSQADPIRNPSDFV